MLEQKPSQFLLFFLSLILYSAIGYLIGRHQTVPLLICYFSLFLIYLLIIREKETGFWILAAVIFRAALLFAVPALSDDFYRFVWDGRLLAAGYHPFAEVPSYYMTHNLHIPGIDETLFNQLNAKETFTVYPPVAQFIFWISVKLSPGSVLGSMFVMRLIIFTFELGTLWLFAKIIRQFNLPANASLSYALNPLVILELTGNLHFEGIVVFFLLLGIFALARDRQLKSTAAYALSIGTKLLPLIFLPALLRHLGWKRAITHWSLTMLFTALLFLPLLNADIINGLSTSLTYYFQRFEFNASIYYLIREAGYLIFGFNIISFAGPALAFVATASILILSFRKLPGKFSGGIDRNLFSTMLWCLLVYFLSTTTLHPWYIITLLAIGVFTPYRFPLVWSGVIFLTYAGYTEKSFSENLLLVALEYAIVFAYLFYETVWMKRRDPS